MYNDVASLMCTQCLIDGILFAGRIMLAVFALITRHKPRVCVICCPCLNACSTHGARVCRTLHLFTHVLTPSPLANMQIEPRSGITNMNTADAQGDAFFDLRSLSTYYSCHIDGDHELLALACACACARTHTQAHTQAHTQHTHTHSLSLSQHTHAHTHTHTGHGAYPGQCDNPEEIADNLVVTQVEVLVNPDYGECVGPPLFKLRGLTTCSDAVCCVASNPPAAPNHACTWDSRVNTCAVLHPLVDAS